MSTLQEGVFAPMAPKHQLPIREPYFSSILCVGKRVEGGPRQKCPKTWEEASGVVLPLFIRTNE